MLAKGVIAKGENRKDVREMGVNWKYMCTECAYARKGCEWNSNGYKGCEWNSNGCKVCEWNSNGCKVCENKSKTLTANPCPALGFAVVGDKSENYNDDEDGGDASTHGRNHKD